MSYVIAAYGVVIGSLVAYGLWLQAQRLGAARQEEGLAARRRELESRPDGTTEES